MTLFFHSCELESDNGGIGFPVAPQYKVYRAFNFSTDTYYDVHAELLYEGVRVNIWAEVAANINRNTARTIANTYDSTILPRMLSAFDDGSIFGNGGVIVARDLIELADYFGDGDGKLAILLLDIKDDFGVGGNNAFIAGYFWPGDLLDMENSNKKDMIYIDINPGLEGGLTGIFNTIAHEVQHLMNFIFSAGVRGREMDIWIDEGLSEAAAWVWNERHNQGRITDYNQDRLGTIARGNNFFVWGNHTAGNPAAILDDYATVYLFFQWLRLQAGDTGIYSDILYSPFFDYRAVTTATNGNPAMAGRGYDDWETLLRTWLAANYINAPSGPYGYLDDPVLRLIQPRYLTGSGSNHPLYPGEGVYTRRTSLPNVTNDFIRYVGLPGRGSDVTPHTTSTSGFNALLSYNINTDSSTTASPSPSTPFSTETVYSEEINTPSMSTFSSRQSPLSIPYAIGARDMLKLNRHEESLFDPDFTKFRIRNYHR
jgi:hypothetical protein